MLNVWYRKASALKFEKYKCIAFSQNIKPCALKFFNHRNALHTVQLICEGNHGENLVYLCGFFFLPLVPILVHQFDFVIKVVAV